jgi:hypothetical protein
MKYFHTLRCPIFKNREGIPIQSAYQIAIPLVMLTCKTTSLISELNCPAAASGTAKQRISNCLITPINSSKLSSM